MISPSMFLRASVRLPVRMSLVRSSLLRPSLITSVFNPVSFKSSVRTASTSGTGFKHDTFKPEIRAADGSKPMTVHTDLPENPLREDRKLKLNTFLVFAVFMTIAVEGIFQYEKVSTPVMNATMYYLRRSKLARDNLGGGITYGGIIPWIVGELNTMRGRVDIHTKVAGDSGSAIMYLKANKEETATEGKLSIKRWDLVKEDGTVLDLLHDEDDIGLEF